MQTGEHEPAKNRHGFNLAGRAAHGLLGGIPFGVVPPIAIDVADMIFSNPYSASPPMQEDIFIGGLGGFIGGASVFPVESGTLDTSREAKRKRRIAAAATIFIDGAAVTAATGSLVRGGIGALSTALGVGFSTFLNRAAKE